MIYFYVRKWYTGDKRILRQARNVLRRVSLGVKITSIVSVLVLVGSLSLGFLALLNLVDLMEKQFRHRAQTTAWALAQLLSSQDVERLATLQPDDPEYATFREFLSGFQEDAGTVYTGVFLRTDGYTAVSLVDTTPGIAPLYLKPLTTINTTEFPIFGSLRSGAETVQVDKDGALYYAGWEPIDFGDDARALVYVLIPLDELGRTVKSIRNTVLLFVLLFTLMAGYTAYRFASSFERTAVLDGLMGIFNHKYFKQRLESEVERSQRYGQQTAVVMVDIDHFKKVNDTYGHQVGDFVLKKMARIVTEQARKSDVVARYGGEEIAIILPFTGLAGAQQYAERLRIKVAETLFEDREEEVELRITCSAGVAKWEPGMTMADLIRHADQALYQSKENGRNRVTLYQDENLVSAAHSEVSAAGSK